MNSLACLSIRATQSTGTGQFCGLFFQNYWTLIGAKAIQDFFSASFLLKDLNSTNLVLIPKVPNTENLPLSVGAKCIISTYLVSG